MKRWARECLEHGETGRAGEASLSGSGNGGIRGRNFSGRHLLKFGETLLQGGEERLGSGKVAAFSSDLHLIGCFVQSHRPHGPAGPLERMALVPDGGGILPGDSFFQGMNPLGGVLEESSQELSQEFLILVDLLE